MLAELPEDSGDEDNGLCSASRTAALSRVREFVAGRWKYIVDLRERVHERHYTVMVERMKDSLDTLLEIHGPHFAFPPNPPEHLLVPPSTEHHGDQSLSMSETRSSSGSTNISGAKCLPHRFKFLAGAGKSKADVWTCLQAQTPTKTFPPR